MKIDKKKRSIECVEMCVHFQLLQNFHAYMYFRKNSGSHFGTIWQSQENHHEINENKTLLRGPQAKPNTEQIEHQIKTELPLDEPRLVCHVKECRSQWSKQQINNGWSFERQTNNRKPNQPIDRCQMFRKRNEQTTRSYQTEKKNQNTHVA